MEMICVFVCPGERIVVLYILIVRLQNQKTDMPALVNFVNYNTYIYVLRSKISQNEFICGRERLDSNLPQVNFDNGY